MKKLLLLLLSIAFLKVGCAFSLQSNKEGLKKLPLEIQDLILQHVVIDNYKDFKNLLTVNKTFNNLLKTPTFRSLFFTTIVTKNPEGALQILKDAVLKKDYSLAKELAGSLNTHGQLKDFIFNIFAKHAKGETDDEEVKKEKQLIIFLLRQPFGVNLAKKIVEHDKTLLDRYLFGAVKHDDRVLIDTLLNAGVSIEADNEGLKTLLRKAIDKGYTEIAKSFIREGADVNKKDWQGVSSLMAAIQKNDIVLVKMLLAKGADVDDADEANKTVLDYARDSGNEAIIKAIEAAQKKK